MSCLDGKIALVTGGASGIGEACVGLLLEEGARVVIADCDEEAAARSAASIGEMALPCYMDTADPDSVETAVNGALGHFGRLDIAINSAGVGVPVSADIEDLSFAEWRRVTSVNLDGVFNSMRSEINAMLRTGGGSIVNISSIMGAVGTRGAAAYVASKHGVVGLTKAAALEYAARGIRVNAVGPGHIQTPMFLRRTPEAQAATAATYPMARIGAPREIAQFVCFVAGPAAGFVTGGYYPIDGGYIAQ